ncbi:MAG: hypothetical protein KAH17_08205, partial [Bacteroidales bacterium]|nr:hypothetical protein [Bacteroidales bacterium]
TKVVTVGSTGSDYTNIAGAAAYLQTRSGGIMLLSAETHNITAAVNLTNTTLIGKDASRTTIQVSGAGQFDAFDTVFEHLTLDVNSITDTMAIDIQSGSSSLIFNYAEADIQDSGDSLIDSNSGTTPTVIMKLIKSNQSGTLGKILNTKALSNLNTSSVIFVDSRSNDDPLELSDWDVTVAGGGSVLTDGTIFSIPARTIFVSPNMNLQGAIDSLEVANNGGLITLLPGVHSITSTLTIEDDDIHIEGYGDSSIISVSGITGGATVGAIQVGTATGTSPVNGVVLKDFKLEITGTGVTDIHGIRIAGGSDNRVDNVTIQKVSGVSGSGNEARMGIQFVDGASTNLIRPVIINSRVLGNSGANAYFTDGIHVTSDPAITGVFGNGNRITNALLDGNFVDYVGETAYVIVGADDNSLFNNRASNMGARGTTAYGIYMGNTTNINMTANIFTGSLSSSAIAIGIESFNAGTLKQTTDSLFNNNIIRGSGSGFATGFQIGNVSNTGVHRNQFQNNQIYGASNLTTTAIVVRGNADKNNFSNNNITGNGNAWDTGISLQSSTQDGNLVRGNRFNNTTTTIVNSATATIFGIGAIVDTTTPTVSDDIGDGYGSGDIWVDTNNDDAYILLDETLGSAVWTQIDGAGGSTPDFEDIYTQDADNTLITTNSDFTINAGIADFSVVSSDFELGSWGTSAGNTNQLEFFELAASGTNYVGFKAPDAITSNAMWTLPSGDGSTGQFLSTNGTGTLSWATSSGGSGSAGWHGSPTRIKLTPMDFQSDDRDDNMNMQTNGTYIQETGTASPVATIAIPTGYRTTHVMIYGSDGANAVNTYANDISNGTTATSLGTGTVNTEINITDTNSTDTNYITIYINVGASDRVYGGYITIEPTP